MKATPGTANRRQSLKESVDAIVGGQKPILISDVLGEVGEAAGTPSALLRNGMAGALVIVLTNNSLSFHRAS